MSKQIAFSVSLYHALKRVMVIFILLYGTALSAGVQEPNSLFKDREIDQTPPKKLEGTIEERTLNTSMSLYKWLFEQSLTTDLNGDGHSDYSALGYYKDKLRVAVLFGGGEIGEWIEYVELLTEEKSVQGICGQQATIFKASDLVTTKCQSCEQIQLNDKTDCGQIQIYWNPTTKSLNWVKSG